MTHNYFFRPLRLRSAGRFFWPAVFLAAASFLFCTPSPAQGWHWAKAAGATSTAFVFGEEAGTSVARDSDGNVYVVGRVMGSTSFGTTTRPTHYGGFDVFIAKYSESGTPLWVQGAGTSGDDVATGVAVDGSGNVYVTGHHRAASGTGSITFGALPGLESTSTGERAFLVKYNAAGTALWSVNMVTPSSTITAQALALDAAGNAFVAGRFGFSGTTTATFGSLPALASTGGADVFVAKYSPAGAALWARKAGGTSTEDATAVTVDKDNNVILTGYFRGSATFGTLPALATVAGGQNIFVAKYDNAGTALWARKAGTAATTSPTLNYTINTETGYGVRSDAGGNVYVTGTFRAGTAAFGTITKTATANHTFFLAKYNAAGAEQWVQTTGTTNASAGRALSVDNAGNVYATGMFGFQTSFGALAAVPATSGSGNELFVVKYDPSGAAQWSDYGGNGGIANDTGLGIAASPDGLYAFVAGTLQGAATFGPHTTGAITGSNDVVVAAYVGVPVNAVPTLNPLTDVAVAPNATNRTIPLAGISAGTGESGQTLVVTATSSNPAIVPHPTVTYTSPGATGSLGITPVSGATGTVTITVTVHDGQAYNHTISRSFVLTVNHVAPSVVINNVTLNQSSFYTVYLWTISPGSAPLENLTATATTDRGDLLYDVEIVPPDPTSIAWRLRFRTRSNGTGVANVTVTLNNGQPVNNTFTTTIQVTVQNAAPTLDPIPNTSVMQGTSKKVKLTGISAGAGATNQTLTVTAVSASPNVFPNPVVEYIGGDTATLTFTPATTDLLGANITVTVKDDQAVNHTTTRTFWISISNAPPSLNRPQNVSIVTSLESSRTVTITGINAGAGAADPGLQLTATSSNRALLPDPVVQYTPGAATANLVITPVPGQMGTAYINLMLKDSQLSALYTSFMVTVSGGAVATVTVTDTTLCTGMPIEVNFTTMGTFPTGTSFDAHLSGADGDFFGFTPIGMVTSGNVIRGTVPANFPAGTNYRVRVIPSEGGTVESTQRIRIGKGPAKPFITPNGNSISATFTLLSSSPAGNQWLRNGQPVPGATGQRYSVTEPGTYTVRVTSGDCDLDSDPIILTGPAEPSAPARVVQVQPNPARDQVRIVYQAARRAGTATVKVYDLRGRRMVEQPLSGVETAINVSAWPAGRYLVRVEDGSTSHPLSFIKQ
jgi:hypothetical protein